MKCEPPEPGQGKPELQTCILLSETHPGPAAGTAGPMGTDWPDDGELSEVTRRPELTHRLAEFILSKPLTAKELAFYSWTHLCTRTIKEDFDVQDGEMPISDSRCLTDLMSRSKPSLGSLLSMPLTAVFLSF